MRKLQKYYFNEDDDHLCFEEDVDCYVKYDDHLLAVSNLLDKIEDNIKIIQRLLNDKMFSKGDYND